MYTRLNLAADHSLVRKYSDGRKSEGTASSNYSKRNFSAIGDEDAANGIAPFREVRYKELFSHGGRGSTLIQSRIFYKLENSCSFSLPLMTAVQRLQVDSLGSSE